MRQLKQVSDLITNARQLRKNLTDSEKRLWLELRLRQTGYKFRRQFAIGKYIVDFACPERKLIVELDGGHHAGQADYDAGRTRWLESQGFRVLRFWNNEIQTNLNGVKEVIYKYLKEAKPPPPSSPVRHYAVGGRPPKTQWRAGEEVNP